MSDILIHSVLPSNLLDVAEMPSVRSLISGTYFGGYDVRDVTKTELPLSAHRITVTRPHYGAFG